MQNNFPLKLSVDLSTKKLSSHTVVTTKHASVYDCSLPPRASTAAENCCLRIFCRSGAGEWEERERQIRLRLQQNHLLCCITTHAHRRECSAGGAANPHRVSRGEKAEISADHSTSPFPPFDASLSPYGEVAGRTPRGCHDDFRWHGDCDG